MNKWFVVINVKIYRHQILEKLLGLSVWRVINLVKGFSIEKLWTLKYNGLKYLISKLVQGSWGIFLKSR